MKKKYFVIDEVDCDNPPCIFGACSQRCDIKQIRKESSSQTVNTQRTTSSAYCSCVTGKTLFLPYAYNSTNLIRC